MTSNLVERDLKFFLWEATIRRLRGRTGSRLLDVPVKRLIQNSGQPLVLNCGLFVLRGLVYSTEIVNVLFLRARGVEMVIDVR